MAVQGWPVEAACLLGFCGWQCPDDEFRQVVAREGLVLGPTRTVGEVEEFFASICFQADQRLGEPAACRWLLDYFDDTPRDIMRRELLAEVELTLLARKAVADAA